MKRFILTLITIILTTCLIYSEDRLSSIPDSVSQNELIAQHSLFYEYYKNKDYASAYSPGWFVVLYGPAMFKRYNLYPKMEDIIWYMRDSVAKTEEEKQIYADTILFFYEKAIPDADDKAGLLMARKAFVLHYWHKRSPEEVISTFEKAMEISPKLDPYYRDLLGVFYRDNATEENDYKLKAIQLYSKLSEEDPSNATWNSRLQSLAENMEELVEIMRKAWELDKENVERAWSFASTAISARDFKSAVEPLIFLTTKSPEVVNYWNQLGTAYMRLDEWDKAINTYKKLLELQPNTKEAFVNLGIAYKEKGQLSTARNYLSRASDVDPSWGYPVFIEGSLYEQAARNCGGSDFVDKLVYQLAQNTYRRAASLDQSIAPQAMERVNALSGAVPSKEDWFFRRSEYKPGTQAQIKGKCYDWIGRSITVPN